MRHLVLIVLAVALVSCAQLKGKWFDKIIIINFENTPLLLTLPQPYFRELVTKKGALLNNYYGVTHPSQPNYLTQIAGDYFGQNNDGNVDLDKTNLVDLLEAKGVTWKSYQENYPGNASYCYTNANFEHKYYRKHNPFMTFDNVRTNAKRCAQIVDSKQLYDDIQQQQLPQYMYYTPNIDNDGHDTGVKYADKWLRGFLEPLLTNTYFMQNTLVFITFDEDNYLEANHIYAAVVGSMIKPAAVDRNKYNHYSLLRTVEDNWGLGTLNRNDSLATSFQILANPSDANIRVLPW